MSRRYHTRVITNIIYSAVLACLVEVFVVTNLSMVGRYAVENGREGSLAAMFYQPEALVVVLYLLLGVAVFSVTFLFLQREALAYITKISAAMQNIAAGDLNTTVEVVGDDEFSVMAANINQMVGEIRELMDKERESERTKNELITNVAHDLRTPLTSIIVRSGTAGAGDAGEIYQYHLYQGETPAEADRGPVRLYEAELRQDLHAGVAGGYH